MQSSRNREPKLRTFQDRLENNSKKIGTKLILKRYKIKNQRKSYPNIKSIQLEL